MDGSSALIILAAILPTAGTVLVSVMSALTGRAVRQVDEKLASIDRKLDGQGERLTRLEAELRALQPRVELLEHRRR